MEELEIYDSSVNINAIYSKISSEMKFSGEFTFKLIPNKTGKIRISFPIPYETTKPNLNVICSCTIGNEVELSHKISKFDKSGFTLHIVNSDTENEITGTINWFSSFF